MQKSARDSLLFDIHAHPRFKELCDEILAARPIVPAFTPKPDNRDEMAHQSSLQQGFELCCKFFDIKIE